VEGTSQVAESLKKSVALDSMVALSLLDRSHGFIAPRPLYTGPLCPTLV
jgi:hypothetical protein